MFNRIFKMCLKSVVGYSAPGQLEMQHPFSPRALESAFLHVWSCWSTTSLFSPSPSLRFFFLLLPPIHTHLRRFPFFPASISSRKRHGPSHSSNSTERFEKIVFVSCGCECAPVVVFPFACFVFVFHHSSQETARPLPHPD